MLNQHTGLVFKLSHRSADPRQSLYFGAPQTYDGQTIKNQKRVKPSTPKYRESQKHGNSAFRRQSNLQFIPLPQIRLT